MKDYELQIQERGAENLDTVEKTALIAKSKNSSSHNQDNVADKKKKRVTCCQCGKRGHVKRDCPKKDEKINKGAGDTSSG